MSINQRIKEVLSIKKLTNEFISKELKVSTSTIYDYLEGIENPDIKFLEFLLIEYPELNLNWLITGNGEMWASLIPKTEQELRFDLIEGKYKYLENMYERLMSNYEALKEHVLVENNEINKNVENSLEGFERMLSPRFLVERVIRYLANNPEFIEKINKEKKSPLKKIIKQIDVGNL